MAKPLLWLFCRKRWSRCTSGSAGCSSPPIGTATPATRLALKFSCPGRAYNSINLYKYRIEYRKNRVPRRAGKSPKIAQRTTKRRPAGTARAGKKRKSVGPPHLRPHFAEIYTEEVPKKPQTSTPRAGKYKNEGRPSAAPYKGGGLLRRPPPLWSFLYLPARGVEVLSFLGTSSV